MKQRIIKFRCWDRVGKKMRTKDMSIRASIDNDGTLNSMGIIGKNPIMQFTGLLDKNGKEIYEGDIVNTPHNGIMQVLFFEGSFQMRKSDMTRSDELTWAFNSEVIGNVFQNSELLNPYK